MIHHISKDGLAIRRTLDWPLNSRFHYGHPDLMDKLQVVQQGGVSKVWCDEAMNQMEYGCFQSHGDTPTAGCFMIKTKVKIDDLGGPHFRKCP